MTYQDLKNSVKRYAEGNGLLNLLMKISPVLVFLRPVADLLILIIKDGGFVNFLGAFDAIFTILFVIGLFFCFMRDQGFPIIGSLVLHEIVLIINLVQYRKDMKDLSFFYEGSTAPGTINYLVYILFYLALLAFAVIQTSRRGDFARASAGFKEFMAPRQEATAVTCPVCGHANAAGVNFCTNCGSALPTAPPQQPVQPQPMQPGQPVQPVQPVQLVQPVQPVQPVQQPAQQPTPPPAQTQPIQPEAPAEAEVPVVEEEE